MKFISRIIFILIISITNVYAQDNKAALKAYVENLINEGYAIYQNKTSSELKKEKEVKNLLKKHLYTDWMAKYSLGRHRKTLPNNKINEFSKVYEVFVINSYSELINKNRDAKAYFKSIKQIDDDLFMVSLKVVTPNGQPPIRMDYLTHVFKKNNKVSFYISDIITEGISILNSQQAEFNSIISNQGIDALIKDLKGRVNYSKMKSVRRHASK